VYSEFVLEPQRALKIFEFIVGAIPPKSLGPTTLVLTLKSTSGSGSVVKISLLDYLNALNSDERPGVDISKLHLYLLRRLSLPRVFVQNAHLRGLESRPPHSLWAAMEVGPEEMDPLEEENNLLAGLVKIVGVVAEVAEELYRREVSKLDKNTWNLKLHFWSKPNTLRKTLNKTDN
jgi:hypothetical protein